MLRKDLCNDALISIGRQVISLYQLLAQGHMLLRALYHSLSMFTIVVILAEKWASAEAWLSRRLAPARALMQLRQPQKL